MALYIYGVIETRHDLRFPISGLFEEEVFTVGCQDLAMVVSRYDADDHGKITGTRKNLLAHQKVAELVMQEYTLLPVRFGTIAEGTDDIQNMLMRQQPLFVKNLRELDYKVELGVKIIWSDMKAIYDEIIRDNAAIRTAKSRLEIQPGQPTSALIEIGKMVEDALLAKKEEESTYAMEWLGQGALQAKTLENIGENMFLNASFLVSKGMENNFDHLVTELANKLGERVTMRYVGPLPPYNFVDLSIMPARWES